MSNQTPSSDPIQQSAPLCAAPDPSPRPPAFVVPAGSCDCHAHICGPADRYAYSPDRIYTPPDALELLRRRNDIDILFTDVVMPQGMSGIELARLTSEIAPGVKVVLASGYPLPALKSDFHDLDQFAFINKPYRLADLARKLRA